MNYIITHLTIIAISVIVIVIRNITKRHNEKFETLCAGIGALMVFGLLAKLYVFMFDQIVEMTLNLFK